MSTLIVPSINELPAHLQDAGMEGTEQLKQYVIPPRLKVMQPMRREPYTDFPEGACVAVPLNIVVAQYDKEFKPALQIIPLFFWAEWCAWNPLESKGQLNVIRERSLDPKSIVAIKARDEKKRKAEICPEMPKDREGKPLYISYQEHLNFLVMPISGPLASQAVCMTFDRGEHKQGTRFSSLINSRRAPIWGCQFEAVIRQRSNDKGRWYGLDVDNPRDGSISPWTSADMKDLLQGLHQEYKKVYDEKRLQVDYELTEEEKPADSKEF